MSEIQEIEVVIGPDGKVRIEVRGVKGPACVDLTRDLERYLGGRVLRREPTDEHGEQPVRDEVAERSRVG
jgi:hypothetical protein